MEHDPSDSLSPEDRRLANLETADFSANSNAPEFNAAQWNDVNVEEWAGFYARHQDTLGVLAGGYGLETARMGDIFEGLPPDYEDMRLTGLDTLAGLLRQKGQDGIAQELGIEPQALDTFVSDLGALTAKNQMSYNCYAFAVGDNDGAAPGAKAMPGGQHAFQSIEDVMRAGIKDGLKPASGAAGSVPDGHYKVHLYAAYDDNGNLADFHWAREGRDGYLYHKSGHTPAGPLTDEQGYHAHGAEPPATIGEYQYIGAFAAPSSGLAVGSPLERVGDLTLPEDAAPDAGQAEVSPPDLQPS